MLTTPTYADAVAASSRIAGQAHRMPVLTAHTADAEAGARLFFKCENFQHMGAFKFRGAAEFGACVAGHDHGLGDH